jgi:hypothetical protein
MRERLNRQLGPRLVPIIAATRTQPPLDVLPLPPLLRPAGPPRRMMVCRLRVQLLPPRQMPHRRRIANLRTRLARARSMFAVSSAPLMRLDIYRLAAPKTRCWYLPTIPWQRQHSTAQHNERQRNRKEFAPNLETAKSRKGATRNHDVHETLNTTRIQIAGSLLTRAQRAVGEQ